MSCRAIRAEVVERAHIDKAQLCLSRRAGAHASTGVAGALSRMTGRRVRDVDVGAVAEEHLSREAVARGAAVVNQVLRPVGDLAAVLGDSVGVVLGKVLLAKAQHGRSIGSIEKERSELGLLTLQSC